MRPLNRLSVDVARILAVLEFAVFLRVPHDEVARKSVLVKKFKRQAIVRVAKEFFPQ